MVQALSTFDSALKPMISDWKTRSANTEVQNAGMPTFRNEMRVKCKLNVAEWVNQLGSCRVEGGVKGQRLCKVSIFGALVLDLLKDLVLRINAQLQQKYLFHKSRYKSPSYVSPPCTHSSFLISAIVSQASALFCIFIEISHQHGCSPVNFLHIFTTTFFKNTTEGLLLYHYQLKKWRAGR